MTLRSQILSPLKRTYRRIPPHLYDGGDSSPARDGGSGGNQEEFQSMGQCCGAGQKEKMEGSDFALTCVN